MPSTITTLPTEILEDILLKASQANESDAPNFTYGLTQAPTSVLVPAKLTKYVRGPLSAESLRWDATCSIRQVCREWHDWALSYNLEQVFERKWRGSERWANLCLKRPSYALYELIDKPSGHHVYRDPSGTLKKTAKLFAQFPSVANHVCRLWFDGFHTAETDRLILSVVSSCSKLTSLTVPWTIVRRGTASDWVSLLKVNSGPGRPLHSLQIQAVSLPSDQATALLTSTSPNPFQDPRVSFASLKRLKVFGNTLHNPITDADLHDIARTAISLECLDITNLSTVSVAGMLALVKASRETLKVLEHSPRSEDGFYHPFPGQLEKGEHMCALIAGLPQMRDLSISVPHMCAEFFGDHEVKWVGECQVRTTELCGYGYGTGPHAQVETLRRTFVAARELIAARVRMQRELRIEIFFAGCIFEPEKRLGDGMGVVHGDFALAEISSNGQWPLHKASSTKGPYGNSGVYEKEEGSWDVVSEEEYLYAVERGWIVL